MKGGQHRNKLAIDTITKYPTFKKKSLVLFFREVSGRHHGV